MILAEKLSFIALLDRVYATWGKPRPADRLIDAAWDALQEFDLDVVEAAVTARIHAGGRFMPTTADLRDECCIQRRSRAPIASFDEAPCATCEGIGQVARRQETHTYGTIGHAEWSKTLSFWSPCPDCERGRRLKRNRSRRQEVA